MGKLCNLRTICGKCNIEGRVKKNEVVVVEMAWSPPKPAHLAFADEWICNGCGRTWIQGFGQYMYLSHYESVFIERLRRVATEEPERLRICWESLDDHDMFGDGLVYILEWLEGVADSDRIVVEGKVIQHGQGVIEMVADARVEDAREADD